MKEPNIFTTSGLVYTKRFDLPAQPTVSPTKGTGIMRIEEVRHLLSDKPLRRPDYRRPPPQ